MNKFIAAAICSGLLAALLAGCGLSGDLYLKAPPADATEGVEDAAAEAAEPSIDTEANPIETDSPPADPFVQP
jgi:predicted small lipoprotein YifL